MSSEVVHAGAHHLPTGGTFLSAPSSANRETRKARSVPVRLPPQAARRRRAPEIPGNVAGRADHRAAESRAAPEFLPLLRWLAIDRVEPGESREAAEGYTIPTLPFEPEEFEKLLAACDTFPPTTTATWVPVGGAGGSQLFVIPRGPGDARTSGGHTRLSVGAVRKSGIRSLSNPPLARIARHRPTSQPFLDERCQLWAAPPLRRRAGLWFPCMHLYRGGRNPPVAWAVAR